MSLSSSELSFLRLMERTKLLSREDMTGNIWKIQAATVYLTSLLSKMQDEKSGSHHQDVLIQYSRDVSQLVMLVEAEQKKTAEDKLAHLARIPTHFPEIHVDLDTSSTEQNASPHSVTIGESSAGVRIRNRTLYRADLRKQLLGENNRRNADAKVDEVSVQDGLQETLANDLLAMTRSLKENMTIAGNVIKDDNKRLTSMSTRVESNKERLAAEGERLAHHAYKCGFDCMLMLIALAIFCSFIFMVVLMKVSPKRVPI